MSTISKELLSGFPVKIHRQPDDPFFKDGNQIFCYHEKTVNNDIDFLVDSITAVHIDEFKCSVKGCLETFTNPMQYNRHYDMLHKFRCQTCSRSFSNNHLLSTHISENHDMFFRAQKEKGIAVYHCLIETCGRTFKAMETRRRHLVEKHKYPADFRFNTAKRNHQKYQNSKQDSESKNYDQSSSFTDTMLYVAGDKEKTILDKSNQRVSEDIDMDNTKAKAKSKQRNRNKANKPPQVQPDGANSVTMSVDGAAVCLSVVNKVVEPDKDEISTVNDIGMDKTSTATVTKQKTKRNRNKTKNKPSATNNNTNNNNAANNELTKNDEMINKEDSRFDIEMDTGDNVSTSTNIGTGELSGNDAPPKKTETTTRKIPANICFGRGIPRGFGKS